MRAAELLPDAVDDDDGDAVADDERFDFGDNLTTSVRTLSAWSSRWRPPRRMVPEPVHVDSRWEPVGADRR
jgi:hypothetical protein